MRNNEIVLLFLINLSFLIFSCSNEKDNSLGNSSLDSIARKESETNKKYYKDVKYFRAYDTVSFSNLSNKTIFAQINFDKEQTQLYYLHPRKDSIYLVLEPTYISGTMEVGIEKSFMVFTKKIEFDCNFFLSEEVDFISRDTNLNKPENRNLNTVILGEFHFIESVIFDNNNFLNPTNFQNSTFRDSVIVLNYYKNKIPDFTHCIFSSGLYCNSSAWDAQNSDKYHVDPPTGTTFFYDFNLSNCSIHGKLDLSYCDFDSSTLIINKTYLPDTIDLSNSSLSR